MKHRINSKSKVIGVSILFFSIITVLNGCKAVQNVQRPAPRIIENIDQNDTSCTSEAKLCPDGSAVGRTGPDCEFDPCPENVTERWIPIDADTIPGVVSFYKFSTEVPGSWLVEAVPEIDAINFYDPDARGETSLEKSQIFIRYFRASDFLTLSTVTIHSRRETSINGRPAVIYDIEKKSSIANFPSQPLWRSQRHLVTDIRSTNDNPSTFYVIGKRPDLSTEIFDRFIQNFDVSGRQSASLIEPVKEFKDRITKKPFGIYITLKNSPVQPERFSGYHTAVDVEYGDVTDEVSVYAIADGTVVRSGLVSGYGGMIAIRHTINDESLLAIYGHLDPATLVKNGSTVVVGERIGILGDGGTNETDGERKHLHFGIYKGTDTNVSGYVSSEKELSKWADPLTLF